MSKKNGLTQKLMKLNKATILEDSPIYSPIDYADTGVPIINLALSGKIDGGVVPGLMMIAGPSKHFKSLFGLILAKAFLEKNPEGILLFYDNESGIPMKYWKQIGVDPARVVRAHIKTIEELRHKAAQTLDELTADDKVMILIDSVGQLASKKELDDAISGKEANDMTRAKVMKSFARVINPYIDELRIPCVAINHVYDSMDTHSAPVVSGGTGIYLASQTVWIVSRRQDRNTTTREIDGYSFTINIDKSRTVKEKSKFPVDVSWKGGLNNASSLLELGLETGHITSPTKGFYTFADDKEEKKHRKKQLTLEHFSGLLSNQEFIDAAESLFQGTGKTLNLTGEGDDSEVIATFEQLSKDIGDDDDGEE